MTGFYIELHYGSTDVESITALDFFPSSRGTSVSRSTEDASDRYVAVSFDGWAFPQSGVAFVRKMMAQE